MEIYTLKISNEADSDFASLINYTAQNYGKVQAINYAKVIQLEMNYISKMPTIGHLRKDMPSRYLARNAGQHVIIYEISKKSHSVSIVRILHTQMDFTQKF